MEDEKILKVISVLIQEPTRTKACEKLGITQRTLYNYFQDEKFKKEYQAVINGLISDAEAKTKEAGLKAVNHLMSILENNNADEMLKIKADKIILEHLAKMIECENKYW